MTNVTNSTLADTQFGLEGNPAINFIQPRSTIQAIYRVRLDNPRIYGYVDMPPTGPYNAWQAGAVLSRYYPVYVYYTGTTIPVPNKEVNITDDSSILVWNGTTDSDGYVQANLTLNSTNYGPGNFTIYWNGTLDINLTTDTPIILESSDTEPPEVNLTSLQNDTWLNYGVDIELNYTANDTESGIANCSLYWDGELNQTETSVQEGINQTFLINASDDGHNWSVSCYDNSTDENRGNSLVWLLNIDTVHPLIAFDTGTELNGTYFNRDWIYANWTFTEADLATITARIFNSTFDLINETTFTSAAYEINWTLADLNEIYYYNISICDLAGNCNSTETRIITLDTAPPVWTNNKTSPASQVIYSPGAGCQFNITWNDNAGMGTVLFEHNFTGTLENHSASGNVSAEYYYNWSDLAAGSYVWRSFANDTVGNMNVTYQWVYVVNKAPTHVNLSLNGTEANLTITYPQTLTAIFSTNILTAAMYRNGTVVSGENNTALTLAAEYYNYTAVNSGNQNYSASSKTFFTTVNRNTSVCSLNFTPASPQDYLTPINVTCSCTNPEAPAELWRNDTDVTGENSQFVLLGAGSYNYTCNVSQSQNYTGAQNSSILNVVRAPNPVWLYLNNQPNQNVTTVWNTTSNATGIATAGTACLFRDWVNVSNPDIAALATKPAGYAYKLNATGNENYTANSTGVIHYLMVDRISSDIDLTLDGHAADILVSEGDSVLINASLITPVTGYLELYSSGVRVKNGSSPLNITSTFASAGTYNITAVYPETENYSSSSVTRFVTAQSAASPPPPPGGGGPGGGPSGPSCQENWNCTDWGDCRQDGTQARDCTDQNACGTNLSKPAEVRDCIYTPPAGGPSCTDGIKNQDETGIDCGGAICPPCENGNGCIIDSDCQSGWCYEGVCRTPTCDDGIQNQDETGIDCGGPCPLCEPRLEFPLSFDWCLIAMILIIIALMLTLVYGLVI